MATIDATGDLSGAGIDAYGDIAVPGQGGPQGPAGEIIGADAVTLPTGQAATVSLGGTLSKRVLHFGLPRGEQGEQGIEGPEGDVTPEALAAKTAAESARDAAGTARQQAQAAQTAAEQARDDSETVRDDITEILHRIDFTDSGWVTAGSPPSGVTWTDPIQYRILNGVVHWRGQIASRDWTANQWVKLTGTLPDVCMPGIGMPLVFTSPDNNGLTGGVYASTKDIEIVSPTSGSSAVRIGGCYPAVPKASVLDVLQLNVWHGAGEVEGGLSLVADIIGQTNADVVLLCESTDSAVAKIRDILKLRGGEWYGVDTGETGVISKFPIISAKANTVPGHENGWAKVVLNLRGLHLVVYSVHLEYRWFTSYLPRGYGAGAPSGVTSEYGWGKMPDAITDLGTIKTVNQASGRAAAMQQIIADAAAEKTAGNLVLIGGDLNEASHLDWTTATKDLYDHHGVVYQWDTTKALADAGWFDGYRELHPDPVTHPGLTWPSDNPNFEPYQLNEGIGDADTRDRMDFIFHPPGVTLVSAKLIGPRGTIANGARNHTETEDDYAPLNISWPSDHKGNMQRFRITR